MDLRVSDVISGWGLRDSAAFPFIWVVTQLGGRVAILVVLAVPGRLPALDAGAPGCRWCASCSPSACSPWWSTRSSRAPGAPRPAYPGVVLLPRRRRVVPLRARGQRGPHVGRRPMAGRRVRPARRACSGRFWLLSVVGPVATGAGDGVAGLPLGHRRGRGRRRGHRAVGRGSRTRRTRSVTLGTCPSRPADRVAARGGDCWRRGGPRGRPRPRLPPARVPPRTRRRRPRSARSPTPGCRSSPAWSAVDDQLLAMNDGGDQVVGLPARRRAARSSTCTPPPSTPTTPRTWRSPPTGRCGWPTPGTTTPTRATVALIALRPDGTTSVYRLTYPDGPHDAEALLLAPDGTPYVVTKEILGASGVYRPAAAAGRRRDRGPGARWPR